MMLRLQRIKFFLIFIAAAAAALNAFAEARFPQPEFESDYQLPTNVNPLPWIQNSGYVQLCVLLVAMGISAYLLLARRSRKGVLTVMLLCLAYFGFYLKGCICVVGSTQNVAMAIFDPSCQIPLALALFFLAPLFLALFFGRVFCGSACPLGAVQDLIVLKPVRLPAWADHTLGILPYFFLGLTVLFVVNNAGFIICSHDPFVALFRFQAPLSMLIASAITLIICTFIGRAYCRFLCPYGALLRLAAFFSKYRVSITPGDCIKCRLCENACPFGAINTPYPEKEPETRAVGKKRIAWILLATPLVVLFSGWCFSRMDSLFAQAHPDVRLARQILSEDISGKPGQNWETFAFRASEKTAAELYADALVIQSNFRRSAWLLGFFIAIVIQGKLLSLSILSGTDTYEADRMKCLSCGRCYSYCPVK